MMRILSPAVSLLPRAIHRSLCVGLLGVALLGGCSDSADDLVAKAKTDVAKSDMKAAAINLRSALQKDTKHREARYMLGTVLRKSGDLPGAEKELRRALELGYDKDQATLILAQVVIAQNKFAEFGSEFGDITLGTAEANAELKSLHGAANVALGRPDEALKAFDEALAIKPNAIPARIGKARIAATKGDLEGAQQVVAQVLTESPKDREALNFKAALLSAKGDRDGVMAIYKALADYYPDGVGELYTYAVSLLEHNKVEEATAVGNKLAKLAPGDARTLHVQALNAFQRRDYAIAQDLAIKAVARAPNFAPAQLVAGAASVQLKAFQQAIQYLSGVVSTQKTNSYARKLLIAAYMGAGENGRAQKELKEALEISPNDPKLLLLAGEIAVSKRDISQATKYFELSAGKNEESGMANLRLGQAHLAAGHEDEGLKILEDAAKAGANNIQSDLALVDHHLRRRQPDKALPWVESIDKKLPTSPLAPSLRGLVLGVKNDSAGARKQFEMALQRDPLHVASLEYLARLDALDKKPEDARRRYDAALKKAPRNPAVAISYARTLMRQGEKVDVVVAPIQAVLKNDPAAVDARLALIEILLRFNDSKQAIAISQEAVKAEPNNATIKMLLGRAQQASGDMNAALATYTEATKLDPKNPQLLMHLADAQMAAGSHNLALDTLKKVLELKPDALPVLQALIITHVRMRDFPAALKLAREVRQKFPGQTTGAELEAGVLVAMENWGEASEVLEQAYKQAPSPGLFMKVYGALNNSGKKERASILLHDWFTKNPKDIGVRLLLAEKASSENNLDVAARYYKEALALQPNSPMLLNNLAFVAAQMKDPKAQGYAEEANKLAPNNPAIMDTLGWLLVEKGDLTHGLELLEKASKGAPDALPIRFNFARALIKAGRKADAKKELEFLASKGEKFKQKAEVDEMLKQL